MVQIILLVMGISALIRGELKVTKTRVVPAALGRLLGLMALGLAAAPFFMDNRSPVPFLITLGGALLLVVAGFALSAPRRADPKPPTDNGPG